MNKSFAFLALIAVVGCERPSPITGVELPEEPETHTYEFTPKDYSSNGGGKLTLTSSGVDFSKARITVGDKLCPNLTTAVGSMTCMIPILPIGDHQIKVQNPSNNTFIETIPTLLAIKEYGTPEVTGIVIDGISKTQTKINFLTVATLDLRGKNISPETTIKVGNSKCELSRTSESQVKCVATIAEKGMLDITATDLTGRNSTLNGAVETTASGGSSKYWYYQKDIGSSWYWYYGTGIGSSKFWYYGTGPGSSKHWYSGTGMGSMNHYYGGTGPGSAKFWYSGENTFGTAKYWYSGANVVGTSTFWYSADGVNSGYAFMPLGGQYDMAFILKDGVIVGVLGVDPTGTYDDDED